MALALKSHKLPLDTFSWYVGKTCDQPEGSNSFRNAVVGSEKSRLFCLSASTDTLAGARVFGDGLRALADGVLGELAGQQETDGGLDLATRDRRTFVMLCEPGRFPSDALKDIVDKRIHDAHRLARDTGVGMYLLQHLVDVDSVALSPSPVPLLVASTNRFSLRDCFLRAFRCSFWSHSFQVLVINT